MTNNEEPQASSPIPSPSEVGSAKSSLKTNATLSDIKKSKEPVISWSPENEEILVEWCDVSKVYKWLSSKSHAKYRKLSARFTLPTIILSTFTGSAAFAQSSLPESAQAMAPMVIGSINIFIGVLSTVQQYLKINELNEGYRVASIAWDKFARNIKIELAKPPSERQDAGSFTKLCRNEYDRLMETSPPIDDDIIKIFKRTFQGKPDSDERAIYDELKKPDICSNIVSCNSTRNPWYKQIDQTTITDDFDNDIEMGNIDFSLEERLNKDETKIDEINELLNMQKLEQMQKDREEEIKKLDADANKKRLAEERIIIQKIVDVFVETQGRQPFIHEVEVSALKQVSEEAVNIFKESYQK